MGKFEGKFSSAKQDWETPLDLFNKLNEEFQFEWDLAAGRDNTKCSQFYDKEQDSLTQPWSGRCWLNPPYGGVKHNSLQNWIIKAYNESQKEGCLVCMLIPARTNTKWWHKYCMQAKEIKFICGRPKFGDATHGLPQPLALVIFEQHDGETKFSSFYM